MKYLVLIAGIALAGCQSTGKVIDTSYNPSQEQYCNTTSVYELSNGTTSSSETLVECTDKPKVNHLARNIGIAGQCKPWQRTVTRPNGSMMVIKGVHCRDKISGAWVPVDPVLSY